QCPTWILDCRTWAPAVEDPRFLFGEDRYAARLTFRSSQAIRMSKSTDAEAAPAVGLTLTFGALQRRLEDFLKDYLKGKSKETVGTYRRSLHEFERWYVTQKGRFRFTTDGVKDYKKYLMETRGLSQVSVSTYLTALRRFCQYLVDIGLIPENPAQAVKGNRRPSSHSRQVLTEKDIDVLIETVTGPTQIDCRDLAMGYLMLYADLSEINRKS